MIYNKYLRPSKMQNQNQSRFWWTVYIVILGGCESLALSNSKHSIRANYPLSYSISSDRGPCCKLHSSPPLYYYEACEELVSEQPQCPVVDNKSTIAEVPTFVGDTESAALSPPLINYICINQALLLLFASSTAIIGSFFGDNPLEISSLHWNEVQEFHSLFDWQPSFFRFIQGIIAAIPIMTMGRAIETSDNRDASRVNFATTNMVISLFGRRKSAMNPTASASFQVMVLSALIAISSGVSEEIIFRGYIPTAISTITHSLPSALFGQAILFAGGHLSKNAQPGENKLNWSLQIFNGVWYGLVYLMTGGDVLPCVIAHVLYDMHTLCETWTQVNNQMDYTQESSMKCIGKEEENAVDRLKIETGITLNSETVNFARHFFYAFDNDHADSLSLSDCQRAVSYAFTNDSIAPDTEVVRDLFEQAKEQRYTDDNSVEYNDRLDFSQFLYLLFVLRSNAREISR